MADRKVHIPRPFIFALFPIGIGTLLSIGLACSSYVLLTETQERQAKAEHLYHEAKRLHTEHEQSRRLKKTIHQTRERLDQIWAILPTQDQFPAVAVAISELARSVDVAIPGMSHSIEPRQDGLPVKGSLTFRAVGEYRNMYRLIDRLEGSDYYFVIESFEGGQAPSRALGEKPLVEFNIRVVTFLRPEIARSGDS